MKSEHGRESTAVITGLGLVCLALFALVSLYSYSPNDVLSYDAADAGEACNKAGVLGAFLAHHAFCLYGVGAWFITVLLLVLGWLACTTRSLAGNFLRALGGILLVVTVCAWSAALEKSGGSWTGYPAGSGGLLGHALVMPYLRTLFGGIGIHLVLAGATVIAGFLLARTLTEVILSLIGRVTVALAHSAGVLIQRRMQPVPSLSGAGTAGHRATGAGPDAARIALPFNPSTRRPRAPGIRVSAPDVEAGDAAVAPESVKRESIAERRAAKVEAEALSEAEETERRRQEALRQAEVAETERLEREKQQREQYQREARALEKLDKERAEKERERGKLSEKFAATLAAAKAAHETAAGEAAPVKTPAPPASPVQYDLPKYDLLIEKDFKPAVTSEMLKERGATLIQTLWDFKIGAKLVGIQSGPAVTMYELELDPGIKVQRVVTLQDNLAMAMKSEHGVRIIAPIPGKATIGIEIPNAEDHTVRLRPILESPQFRGRNWTLPIVLGRDAVGNALVGDLSHMPHLLIAGTTGSGKSVCVNSIILSIMITRKPDEVKLILVDPKQVEMTDFKGIPHLLSPVVTDMKMAAGVLTWAVQKMEQRYERMSRVGVRNIATFNKLSGEERIGRLPEGEAPEDYREAMPYIVIVIDEFADLMMSAGKEIEQAICRLAQKARAAGIHVILATQRPSVDVVTGLIKSNLPCRICFQVKGKIDSRIVLDQGGAEKLAGKGDMLYIGVGNANLIRAKGVYISDDEIRGVVNSCKQQAEPVYSEEVERVAAAAAQTEGAAEPENRQAIELDEKFDEGVEVFLAHGRASTSLLQRRMGLGYTRAAKLCDQMECRGIVGPDRGPKGRELLITQDSWQQFKNIRSGAAGSAWGPKGSLDNPDVPPASVAGTISADDAGTRPGQELNPALVAQLSPVDGVKDPDDVPEDEP